METVFFYLIFFFFQQVETVTEISGNPLLGGKTLLPLAEKDFLPSENCFILFRASFLEVKTVTKSSCKKLPVLFMK